eukprot:TRINITY_DN103480_c0_g1_i1.p1 TRINITY_DN103480_c0_g1~~TRINITY_DN103480_c0_g1_i1.p1  ORF type:complete len:337 (-),score=43.22 TRINITY_DN103480_c0_g1_i1:89-1099(-)
MEFTAQRPQGLFGFDLQQAARKPLDEYEQFVKLALTETTIRTLALDSLSNLPFSTQVFVRQLQMQVQQHDEYAEIKQEQERLRQADVDEDVDNDTPVPSSTTLPPGEAGTQQARTSWTLNLRAPQERAVDTVAQALATLAGFWKDPFKLTSKQLPIQIGTISYISIPDMLVVDSVCDTVVIIWEDKNRKRHGANVSTPALGQVAGELLAALQYSLFKHPDWQHHTAYGIRIVHTFISFFKVKATSAQLHSISWGYVPHPLLDVEMYPDVTKQTGGSLVYGTNLLNPNNTKFIGAVLQCLKEELEKVWKDNQEDAVRPKATATSLAKHDEETDMDTW